jgi:hypothetical protein
MLENTNRPRVVHFEDCRLTAEYPAENILVGETLHFTTCAKTNEIRRLGGLSQKLTTILTSHETAISQTNPAKL